jgi:hypothetical protein
MTYIDHNGTIVELDLTNYVKYDASVNYGGFWEFKVESVTSFDNDGNEVVNNVNDIERTCGNNIYSELFDFINYKTKMT